ncbi:MAG TPA: RHS repeat-associated core domain-containing protein, partial [Pirellulaceae bacterium]|nr:RHS repeat-associated core domain-containing protein [Pirellulaceae bacterium]
MGMFGAAGMTQVGDRTYLMEFPFALNESGPYHFRLLPTLKDIEGFPLDQNANGIPGEPEDFYAFTLILDAVAPRITNHAPSGDVAGTVSHVDVWFSERIDKTTFTASDVTITRPDGQSVAVTGIQEIGFNRFRLAFAPQTLVGVYNVLVGPDVRDLAGNWLDQDGDAVFGENGDDVYNASFHIVPVDLGLNNLVVHASQLWAGEPVTVSWNGFNRTGAPLLGSWADGLYLSTDDQWDIRDVLLATVPHTGGLAENQSYTQAVEVVIPGKLPGNYHILVRADVANQERETNEADNLSASVPLPLIVRSLPTSGAPAAGSFSGADRVDYYAVTLAGGDSLKLRLDTSAGSHAELLVSYAGIPTRVTFDERSAIPGVHQEVSLTGIAGGGTYYVQVYGDQITGPTTYSITAEVAPFFVTRVGPARHGIAAPADLTILGSGFDTNTVVEFVNSAGIARRVLPGFVSPTAVSLHIDFAAPLPPGIPSFNWTPGLYSVRVTKGAATFTLPSAFEVTQGGAATLQTNLVVPSAVSPGFPNKQTVWVEYRNTGTVGMPAPLLQVSVGGDGLLTGSEALANSIMNTRTRPAGLGSSLQVLGIGSSATPGTLQPGESGRIPIYYVGLKQDRGQNSLSFSLGSLTALDTTEKVAYITDPNERVVFERPRTGDRSGSYPIAVEPFRVVRADPQPGTSFPIASTAGGTGGGGVSTGPPPPPNVFEEWLTIDWHAVLDTRPDSIPADAWSAIVYNLRHSYFDLWADYVTEMAENANQLAAVGQVTSDLGALWGFEVAQASASLSPVRYLAGAVDSSIAAPGLPLTFSRVYGQDLVSRFRQGVLGRGWTHNWDISAKIVEPNGDVVLHGPGGVDRFFTKNINGTFTAAAGDFGKLTFANNAYRLTETDGTVWQFGTNNKLNFVEDTNANRITLAYTSGFLTSLTHSSGRQILLEYDILDFGADPRLVRVVDTAGAGSADDRITSFEYDPDRQHMIRATAPGGRVTAYDYRPANGTANFVYAGHNDSGTFPTPVTGLFTPDSFALRTVTQPDGSHDFFSYDSAGRLTRTERDGGAEQVNFIHQPIDGGSPGQVVVLDATGKRTSLQFGLGGQLAQVRDGEGRVVQFGYDKQFQFASLTGPGGERYRYGYDAIGNLTGIRDALNLQTSFAYEPAHQRLASFTDARGNGIDYSYDSKGNLTRITYEDGTHEDFTYDTRGNVLTSTNRRGQVIAFTYNVAGQVLTKDYLTTGGIDFVYTYDTFGNLTSARDPAGTTTMAYESLTDRLARIDYPGGKFFTFLYDAAGRRTRRTDQDGNVENYAYDSIGRLNVMTDGTGNLIVDYDYDSAGRLSKKTLGNGVFTTYAYDPAGNITSLVNFQPGGAVLSRFDYTYDVSGRRTSMTTLAGRFDYGYDALGQLTRVAHPDGRVVVYDYDEAGNRRQVVDGGVATPYTTNALNQYTQVGGVTYAFDTDGNLISQTENGVTTTYTYDIENRLVGVTRPGEDWAYRYDALGNRVGVTENGVATTFIIDPTGLGNVAAEFDSSNQLIARYDHGYGLVSRTDAIGDPAYYTFEAIGHTSELTDAAGGVLNAYAYDPFGISLSKTEAIANPFEYVGEYGVMNEGNGLEFMRARYYDVRIGRFAAPDPIRIAGGLNIYEYVDNDPLFEVDPSGSIAIIPWWLVRIGLYCYANTEFCSQLAQNVLEIGKQAKNRFPYAPKIPSVPVPDPSPGQPTPQPHPTPTPNPTPQPSPSPIPPLGPGPKLYPVPVARSSDPNDKLAPAGYGAFIQADGSLAYTVRFENQPSATGPAREIIVTDIFDPDLDLDTFELTEIAFADQRIAVPAGLAHFETTVPLMANGTPIQVEVTADLDRDTRQLTLLLRAVDPLTGWSPENPLVGLLYPNDATGRGEGSISYVVRPKLGLPSGTVIENRARIFFDFNDPIDTPLVFNTLDALPPASQVAALPAETLDPAFTVTWAGTDDPGGSDIAGYDLFVSDNDGPSFALVRGTTATSFPFIGEFGHTYAFYTIAHDNVGHVETAPVVPDTVILVRSPNDPPVLDPIGSKTVAEGQTLSFQVTATDPNVGDTLTFSLDPGAPAGAAINAETGVFSWAPDDGPASVSVTIRVHDGASPALDDFETITIAVNNVAPIGTLTNGGPVPEGASGLVSFTEQFDPSSADAAAGFLYSFDFDNDGVFELEGSLVSSATVPAAFLADGPASRTVRARIADKDGDYNDYT